jgi:hypothetical protein
VKVDYIRASTGGKDETGFSNGDVVYSYTVKH